MDDIWKKASDAAKETFDKASDAAEHAAAMAAADTTTKLQALVVTLQDGVTA